MKDIDLDEWERHLPDFLKPVKEKPKLAILIDEYEERFGKTWSTAGYSPTDEELTEIFETCLQENRTFYDVSGFDHTGLGEDDYIEDTSTMHTHGAFLIPASTSQAYFTVCFLRLRYMLTHGRDRFFAAVFSYLLCHIAAYMVRAAGREIVL